MGKSLAQRYKVNGMKTQLQKNPKSGKVTA